MIRREFWLALALLLAVNAMVLTGVTWNRHAPAEASLLLSERELPLTGSFSGEENSGVTLALDWHQWQGEWPWLDRTKLQELGFDLASARAVKPEHDLHLLSRKAFVVLELEGAAWEAHRARQQAKLAQLEAQAAAWRAGQANTGKAEHPAEKDSAESENLKVDAENPDGKDPTEYERRQIEGDLMAGSRLFAIDAGRDPLELRRRYPDRNRTVVVAARFGVRPYALDDKSDTSPGMIEEVLVDTLHVPRDLAASLRSLPTQGQLFTGYRYYDGKTPLAPRYQAQVDWGRRHEPWLVAVFPLPLP